MSLSLIAPSRARCTTIPVFLCPAFIEAPSPQPRPHRTFSTSPSTATRRTTGPNRQRGVSAIRSKPPKAKTEVYKYDLPTPVVDPEKRAAFKMNPNHGLWGFFDESRASLLPVNKEWEHGRAWAFKELQAKSFEDLQKLYWVCVMDLNRVATRRKELKRLSAGFGENEQLQRMRTVQQTMKNIRKVLQSRYDSWQAARELMNTKWMDELMADIDAEYEERELTPAEKQELVERRKREAELEKLAASAESVPESEEVLLEADEALQPEKRA